MHLQKLEYSPELLRKVVASAATVSNFHQKTFTELAADLQASLIYGVVLNDKVSGVLVFKVLESNGEKRLALTEAVCYGAFWSFGAFVEALKGLGKYLGCSKIETTVFPERLRQAYQTRLAQRAGVKIESTTFVVEIEDGQ